jgi:hypothetical protein
MIVSSYIAALGSCDLSWGVNERIIANALVDLNKGLALHRHPMGKISVFRTDINDQLRSRRKGESPR